MKFLAYCYLLFYRAVGTLGKWKIKYELYGWICITFGCRFIPDRLACKTIDENLKRSFPIYIWI